MTTSEGEKTALREVRSVRVYAIHDHFIFDLTSNQMCATAGNEPSKRPVCVLDRVRFKL